MSTVSERLTYANQSLMGLVAIRRDMVRNATANKTRDDWEAAAAIEAANAQCYVNLLSRYTGDTWAGAKVSIAVMGADADDVQAEVDALKSVADAYLAADRSTQAAFVASCDWILANVEAPVDFWG